MLARFFCFVLFLLAQGKKSKLMLTMHIVFHTEALKLDVCTSIHIADLSAGLREKKIMRVMNAKA